MVKEMTVEELNRERIGKMITVEQVNSLKEIRFLFDHWSESRGVSEKYYSISIYKPVHDFKTWEVTWIGDHFDKWMGEFTSDNNSEEMASTVSNYFKWLEDDTGSAWEEAELMGSAELVDDCLIFKFWKPGMERNVSL